MSWGGGTDVMSDLINCLNMDELDLPHESKMTILKEMIKSLQHLDWDDTCECEGMDPVFSEALEQVRREWCEKHGDDYNERYGDAE